ncbi:MAG: helix-turn-helix transcriptional regulator [Desulfovibrionaceae bacterium]|nr:helix-turn-helix transcriptional regulator [Desulfovibrionaceae bacterium]
MDDLAKSACVSKSECLRCFKTILQTTPYKYLMDYRLSEATRLLKTTNHPIGEIAIMTGFNGQSYFGKCFKEKMGCSPSEYREKHQA